MTSESSNALSRLGWIAIAIVIAALGVLLGMRLRARPSIEEPKLTIPAQLAVSKTFPNVAISDEAGRDTTTHAVLGDKGAVVIMIDVECRPCSLMTTRFQHLIDDGSLAREQVVGITAVGPETIRSYKTDKRLTFAIYSDPTRTFMRDYGVMNYPLRLDVDRSHTIRAATFDANEAVSIAKLKQELER
jgi:peroxiredoxin